MKKEEILNKNINAIPEPYRSGILTQRNGGEANIRSELSCSVAYSMITWRTTKEKAQYWLDFYDILHEYEGNNNNLMNNLNEKE